MIPTRKWMVAQVFATAALSTAWVTTGSWDQEETLMLIGYLTAALATYLIPNKD